MFCPECGAEFDEAEPKCPFCGQMNPRGAQEAYMKKLRALNDQTERLADEAEEAVRQQTRENGRALIRVLVIIFAVAAILVAIAKISEARREKEMLRYLREDSGYAAVCYEEVPDTL